MSHQFGYAFILIRSFFAKSFPYREHRVNYSLYGVEVSGGFCRLTFYIILLEIVVQTPVHAFYRPMVAHDDSELRSIRRHTADIQAFSQSVRPC